MEDLKRILAVAVGPKRDLHIRAKIGLTDVRPYVEGLIAGLASRNRHAGTHYEIEYRERPLFDGKASAADAFNPKDGTPHDLVFGMSTTVVRAAKGLIPSKPILGVVSEPKIEGFAKSANIGGISAKRSQTAGQCFEYFLATVPTLKRVHVLHKPGYGPSNRALKLVKAAAKKRGVAIKPVNISYREDIEKKLSALAKRDLKKPADTGVLVLPVDVCLGAARLIVEIAQNQKNLPTFFPITDCVTSKPSALGGYGVPQHTCGELIAELVDQVLWGGSKPSDIKVKDAGDDTFKWVVNAEAAKALNIRIPQVV